MNPTRLKAMKVAAGIADGCSRSVSDAGESSVDLPDGYQALQTLEQIATIHRPPWLDNSPQDDVHQNPGMPLRWGHLYINDQVHTSDSIDEYVAYDPVLDRDVLLVLIDEHHIVDETNFGFLHRVRSIAALRHSQLIPVYGADQNNGRAGYWRDIDTSGIPLLEQESRSWSPDEVSQLAAEVSEVLMAIHEADLVHGGVNLLSIRSRGDAPVLLDQLRYNNGYDDNGADSPHLQCTLAPELYVNAIPNPAIDMFALGALCCYLLTGKYPFQVRPADSEEAAEGEETEAGYQVRELTPLSTIDSSIPEATSQWVDELLSEDPDKRPTAASLHHRLSSATHSDGVTTTVNRTVTRERLPVGYKALWAMVGTLLLAVAVISFRFYQASPGTDAGATVAEASQTETVQDNQSGQDLRLADRRLLLAELIADGQQQNVNLDQVISVFATELSDHSSMEPVAMRDWQVELARAYRLIGSDDASIAMFEQALQPIAGVDTNMFDLADVDLERIQFMLDRDELSAAEKALSSGPLSRLPDDHEMSATRLLMLGTLQLGQQRYQEAEQTLLNLMTADSVNPAEGSDETRASMKQQAKSLLAKTYHHQGRYRQAVRHRQQLLDTALADGSGRIDILQLRHDLADSLVGQGSYSESVRVINDGLSELNQMTEPNTFQRVRFLQQLALVSQLGGEMVTAQNFLSRAMKLALEDEEMDQVKLIELRIKQAEVNLALRDFDSARQILRHNVVDASEQLGREHYLTLASEYLLGRYQIETGQFKRGEILLREILDRVGAEGRRQKQLRFDIEDHIAIGLSGQNNYLEAEKLHLSVLESKQAYYGDDHLETMNTLERLADTLQRSGQLLNASESFQRLVTVRSAQLPNGHRDILRAQRKLNNLNQAGS